VRGQRHWPWLRLQLLAQHEEVECDHRGNADGCSLAKLAGEKSAVIHFPAPSKVTANQLAIGVPIRAIGGKAANQELNDFRHVGIIASYW